LYFDARLKANEYDGTRLGKPTMKPIIRMMTTICSENLTLSKEFYTKLFKLTVNYDSDWFIQLISPDKQLELGIIDRTNEIVPRNSQTNPGGFYITFVVDNADEVFGLAKSEGFEIIREPADTFYGQRQLLLKDPNGVVVDVSSPIPNFEFK
jgi:predicted enzyme related to lactoylglutathione lyase